jgi:hypothetical protein
MAFSSIIRGAKAKYMACSFLLEGLKQPRYGSSFEKRR